MSLSPLCHVSQQPCEPRARVIFRLFFATTVWFWLLDFASPASDQAATQGQMTELEQALMERIREAEANITELQGAEDAEKNKKEKKKNGERTRLVR